MTRVLEANGETHPPGLRLLASESSHIESESAEHDLHCFQAFRRMDEILVANFHVFDDVVTEDHFDLWIGDEAWDIDYFLHENPERKRAAYCWLTDFVGWLPMPEGGEHEATLTTDYNAEMIEQIERFGRIRDRAHLRRQPRRHRPRPVRRRPAAIRDWTEQHYDFAGYVTGLRPRRRRRPRRRCVPSSATGPTSRCASSPSAAPASASASCARSSTPTRRPRPGPRAAHGRRGRPPHRSRSPAHPRGARGPGLRPDLYRHLAACDLAIVQGGLTTSMELTANRRPSCTSRWQHFEQTLLVPHRLDRYRAGRRMDYATDHADTSRPSPTRSAAPRRLPPVETDGAARAAAAIADLV